MPKKIDRALLLRKLQISWHKALSRLLPLGGFSVHNTVTIFHSGDEAFAAIYDEICRAEKSIYIETYILAADRVGKWLREALIAASLRGVKVTILYDHLGSAGLPNSFIDPMVKANINVLAFNPMWPWRRWGPLLFRNHRKSLVMDERVAFCGSANISEDYAGPIYGNSRFRDTFARVVGPAVKDILTITRESLAEAQFDRSSTLAFSEMIPMTANIRKPLQLFFSRLAKNSPRVTLDNNGSLVHVLRSNMRRNLAHIQRSMEESVNGAVNYCYFTTPYFLPHDGLRKALIHAKQRGVDVRILTAGISDVPLMRYASYHVYKNFIDKGIRIYEMTERTLHAKIATIDGLYSSIGSYNLDHWSARRNLELNLAIIDQNIALGLKDQFAEDLTLSRELEGKDLAARSIFKRFLSWIAYLLMKT